MTLAPCPMCGAQTNPGAACTACGTPVPALAGEPSGHARYWDGLLDKLRAAASPRYDVRGLLGYGGMAGVFLADEPRLGRRVAIKVLSPALMADPQLVERFVQEARTIALLDHPNIVTVFEVDERDGLHWFTMRYVGGRTLGQVMTESLAPLPIDVVLAWLFQIGDALMYAHANGVVHRDIKPGNVLIDVRGNALVTDFGIAKVADGEAGLTRTGMLVGTPAYMSPEQCTSGVITGASDQYSFGAVLYQMLTGQAPFAGPTLAVLQAHVADVAPPIQDFRPDCPPQLAGAVHRMLEKRQEDRWPALADLIDATGAAPPGMREPIRSRLKGVAAQAVTVAVSGWRETLAEGSSMAVEAAVRDAAGRELTGRRIDWTSSAPAVAAVTENGTLCALSPGEAQLTVRCGSAATVKPISVTADPVSDVQLQPASARVAPGADRQFRARVLDLDGSPLDERAVLWSSSDPAVASVSATGLVRGLTAGQAVIIASTGGRTAQVEVVVAGTPVPAAPARTKPGQVSGERAVGATSGAGTGAGTAGGAERAKPRRRRMAILASAAFLATAVVAAAAVLRDGGEPAALPEAAPVADAAPGPDPETVPPEAADTPPDTANAEAANADAEAANAAEAQTGAAASVTPPPPGSPEPADTMTAAPKPPMDGTVGVAGNLPASAVITVRDSAGRTRNLTSRSITLAPGTYILEARAPGHEPDQRTVVLGPGATETWTPSLPAVSAPVDPPDLAQQDSQASEPDPVDTRADVAAIESQIRAFAAAFDARNGTRVVPFLPESRRDAYAQMLGDTRNVPTFDATLDSVQPITIQGDAAVVQFVIDVSFWNAGQTRTDRLTITARAERNGSEWRLVPPGGTTSWP